MTTVSWQRAQSLYTLTPPTAAHVVSDDPARTVCGRVIPPQARPGYTEQGRAWFNARVFVVDPADYEADGVRPCARCAS